MKSKAKTLIQQVCLILLFVPIALLAGPEDKMEGNDVYQNPKKEFNFGKLKYLKKSDTIFIPYVTVKLQNWGTQGAVAQTGGFGSKSATQTAQSSATLSVAVEPQLAQTLATEIHRDLVEKMKAEGWNVLTMDDVKDSKAYSKLKWEKVKDEIAPGIKLEKNDGKVLGVGMADGSGAGYIIALPEGQQFLKYGITGPAWALRKVTAEQKANIFIPTYTINTMYFNAESKGGYKRASASVDSGALVCLQNVEALYLNPKQAGGSIFLDGKAWCKNNGVASGKVVSSEDTSPKAANALGAAFRAIGGAGIQRSASEKVIEADEVAIKTESLRLVAAYNDIVSRAMSLYKGK